MGLELPPYFWFCGALVAVTSGIGYFTTLHPSVAGGDSGELMCVAHQLGTPHPPGYPTFAFTTKLAEVALVSWLNVPVAMAQNMFHTFLSVLSVAFLYASGAILSRSSGAGIAGALLFGFAPNVWTYATSTEVFPLNNFFMAVLLCLVVVFAAPDAGLRNPTLSRSRVFVFGASFWSGLAMTNQHTSILFVAPVALWVFCTFPRMVKEPLVLITATMCFFLGLTPYIYLPLSSHYVTTTNSWGKLNTFAGFKQHFFREEYGTFSLASKEADYRTWHFVKTWRYFLSDIGDQTLGVFWVFAVLGVVVAVLRSSTVRGSRAQTDKEKHSDEEKEEEVIGSKRGAKPAKSSLRGKRQISASSPAPVSLGKRARRVVGNLGASSEGILLLTWIFYTNFFNYLSNLPIEKPLFYGVQQRFWIQPLLILALFCASGISIASQYVLEKYLEHSDRSIALCQIVIGLLVGLSQIGMNYDTHNERENFYIRDFGYRILAPLPQNALLLTKGDIMINSARALQVTEGFRPDVRIVDQELLTFKWYNELVREEWGESVLAEFDEKDNSECDGANRSMDAMKCGGGVILPGESYFPNKPNTYDMAGILRKNRYDEIWDKTNGKSAPVVQQKDASGKEKCGGKRGTRRVFVAAGLKEGDFSSEAAGWELIPHSIASEVVKKTQSKAMMSPNEVLPKKMTTEKQKTEVMTAVKGYMQELLTEELLSHRRMKTFTAAEQKTELYRVFQARLRRFEELMEAVPQLLVVSEKNNVSTTPVARYGHDDGIAAKEDFPHLISATRLDLQGDFFKCHKPVSPHRVPPAQHYPHTSWEQVVTNDFASSLAMTAHSLLQLGESALNGAHDAGRRLSDSSQANVPPLTFKFADVVGSPLRVPPRTSHDGTIEAAVAKWIVSVERNKTIPLAYRALLAARKCYRMELYLSDNNYFSNKHVITRRNLGVTLQLISRLHGDEDVGVLEELHETFSDHIKEGVEHRNTLLRSGLTNTQEWYLQPQDEQQVKGAAAQFANMIRSLKQKKGKKKKN